MEQENAGQGCAAGADPQQDDLDVRVQSSLDNITYKLVVMSGKGGVGKSTVSMYLALGLAARGYSVGLLDVDLHGPSIPRMLGINGNAFVKEAEQVIHPVTIDHGLKVMSVELLMPDKESSVIWRGPMKIGVIRQFMGDVKWGRLDYLIIDSPPGTGDEPLTVAQNVDGAQAVVVTTPQEIALADVRKSLDFCRQMEMPIMGIVENMSGLVCPHCGEAIELLGNGGGQALAERFGLAFLGRIAWDPELAKAADRGRPLNMEGDGDGPGAAYGSLVDQVVERTAKRHNLAGGAEK